MIKSGSYTSWNKYRKECRKDLNTYFDEFWDGLKPAKRVRKPKKKTKLDEDESEEEYFRKDVAAVVRDINARGGVPPKTLDDWIRSYSGISGKVRTYLRDEIYGQL